MHLVVLLYVYCVCVCVCVCVYVYVCVCWMFYVLSAEFVCWRIWVSDI